MAAVEFVDGLTPPWAKGGAVGAMWSVFRFLALLIDLVLEGVHQGRRAGLPNAVDIPGVPAYGGYEDVKALTKYLAPDAGVYQGPQETPLTIAKRVRHAQDPADPGSWPNAGLIHGVMEQLAAVLGPTPPLMRIVNRQGDWWTRRTDGAYEFVRPTGLGLTIAPNGQTSLLTTVGHAWDWDSTSHPVPANGGAGDWWLIIYAPVCAPYGTTTDGTCNDLGQCADLWNSPAGDPQFGSPGAAQNPQGGTVGTNTPYFLVELIRGVVAQRATAGWTCLSIIVAQDSQSFLPDGTSTAGSSRSAYPDGTWAWHTTWDSGTNTRAVARLQTAEYWLGPRYFGQNT